MSEVALGYGAAATGASPAPRRRRAPGRGWRLAALALAGLALLPVLGLLAAALGPTDGFRPAALARAAGETAALLGLVGLVTVMVGAGAAWLVTAYDFPGRRLAEALLLLPLAVPTYVVAYVYLDLLHPVGPVQSALRAALGLGGPADLRLPDLRSLGGCALVLGLVLYPYVYLPARAAFLSSAAGAVEAARALGAGPVRLFLRVGLPAARPAVAAGAALALLEAMNDVGAVEFLGVRTLTAQVQVAFATRADLPGAARLALVALLVCGLLAAAERRARGARGFGAPSPRRAAPRRLSGAPALAALGLALLPAGLGFAAPAAHLAAESVARLRFAAPSADLAREALASLALAGATTALALGLALLAVAAGRLSGAARLAGGLRAAAALGYALPGTVLALGLLGPFALVDGLADDAARALGLAGTGLVMVGTSAGLVLALSLRFLAIGAGGLEAGLAAQAPALEAAARSLGRTAAGAFRGAALPVARPALAAAALLVFVDAMKELPVTLLLRPLGVETLATHVYAEAARGTYEEGALAALLIVAVGLLPVALLARAGRRPGE